MLFPLLQGLSRSEMAKFVQWLSEGLTKVWFISNIVIQSKSTSYGLCVFFFGVCMPACPPFCLAGRQTGIIISDLNVTWTATEHFLKYISNYKQIKNKHMSSWDMYYWDIKFSILQYLALKKEEKKDKRAPFFPPSKNCKVYKECY